MGTRKIARDRLDRLWRRWTNKDGHKWADYLKDKIANIGGVYALPMENANRLMNEAYRAGFAEGLREAKRIAGEPITQKASVVGFSGPPCVCGEPNTPGVTHRTDSPCFVTPQR